jgi:hypothetical protein
MRHHFVDWLEGEDQQWRTSPHQARYYQQPGDAAEGSSEVEVATIARGGVC